MLPETKDVEIKEGQILPSLTYKINYDEKKISKYLNDIESVKQAIKLILSIDRYAHPIYTGDYGNELFGLKGKSYDYIVADLPRRINEALLQDDRILGTHSYTFSQNNLDEIEVEFTVETIFDDIPYELEVG